VLYRTGHVPEASAQLVQALALDPDNTQAIEWQRLIKATTP
jgi:hypothetical protein